MFDLDSWQEVFATLRKNRLRTALTGLGVFLGILILMIMVAFNRSLEAGVSKQMFGFATNAVWVWAQQTTQAHAGLPPNRRIQFDNGDSEALAQLPEIDALAPRIQGANRVVIYGNKKGSFFVIGDPPADARIELPILRAGRFIDDADMAERRKVAAIGEGVLEQLFAPGQDPIGRYIEVGGVWFQVIGVTGTRTKGQGADRRLNTVQIPFTTYQQVFHAGDKVGWYGMTSRAGVPAEVAEARVKALLARRHKVAPTDDQAIGSWNSGKQWDKLVSLFRTMDLVMWFAGIMTLAAGVIGVVNIMLISVRERTKEIGVRKALGATPFAVVRMIVSEAIVLTMLAGYLGIVAGVGAIELWTRAIPFLGDRAPFGPPDVGLGLALGAGAVIVLFGALAGVIPAAHAAAIQPIEALRTE